MHGEAQVTRTCGVVEGRAASFQVHPAGVGANQRTVVAAWAMAARSNIRAA
jgi:hypothetical protein